MRFPGVILALALLVAPLRAEEQFIDAHVNRKLQQLKLPPSPRCTDSDFIRRAALDATGVLPTMTETSRFLTDPDPHKRIKLVDSLLARDEFVDYWTYKWCDLLLVSSRKLNNKAMWSFYGWVREAVLNNQPWDEFARTLLTATGSNLENGAANYFVLHQETLDLAETTTQAFLGMSVMCARCHNHPLEKWTNQDYYAFANLFARVALKNGDVPGETLIFPVPTGDLVNPRTGKPLPPRPLDGKPLPLADPRDRRAALAAWMTSPQNPYFGRAVVNRVWRNFMGRGLVEAEDDLRLTNPPSNPELLDGLVKDFIAGRFDVRRLIRTIMLSQAYQRSSEPVHGNEQDDRFYSRYFVRRLPAEVLLDALSEATGVPTEFGTVKARDFRFDTASISKGTRALQLPDSRVVSYFLDAFGRAPREQTCSCERQEAPSVQQALHLANGDTINQKLRGSPVIEAMVKSNAGDDEVIRRVFLIALCRLPTETERARMTPLLVGTTGPDRRSALEDLFAAVLTCKEFLFNH